jgi:hypothetical protein
MICLQPSQLSEISQPLIIAALGDLADVAKDAKVH